MAYNIAVVGATGAVGREMLQTLFERKFPVKNVYALASKSSIGKEISFGDEKILKVKSVDDFNFENVDIALFSAGSKIAKKFGNIEGKINKSKINSIIVRLISFENEELFYDANINSDSSFKITQVPEGQYYLMVFYLQKYGWAWEP